MSTSTLGVPDVLHHARITGVGAYRPEHVVPNSEIIEAIDSSDEWIRERSGIASRHKAAPDESVVDMAEHASRDALAYAGLDATQIGAVVVATVTHPFQTPAAAPELASRLGSAAAAFDVSAACAGYCHGISLANDMVRVGTAEHVLVVGVEKLLDFTDPQDRDCGIARPLRVTQILPGVELEGGAGPVPGRKLVNLSSRPYSLSISRAVSASTAS